MFCPKCGTKAIEGAGFCQKCGAKLNFSDTIQPVVDSPAIPTKQASGTSGDAPKKKKKLPIIIGAVVLLVVIIVAAICLISGGGGRDNVATVQAHKPFAVSQNLPYTYGEVFDKYLSNPLWYVDSEDEKTGVAIVNVDGTIKGTEYKFWASIEVSPNPDNPDGCIIRPQSVNFDGTESSGQNEAVEFLYHMFAAYDKGYEDLSELLSSPGGTVNTELSQIYENEDMGISFQYPNDWELFEVGGMSVSITRNTTGHIAVFEVVNTLQSNPFGIFTDDTAAIEAAVSQSGNTTVQSIEDATISGIPVRVLNYRTGGLNGAEPVNVRSCYYINGDSAYNIVCSCSESTADTYQELFDAILDSCTITPIEGSPTTPSQAEGFGEVTPASEALLFCGVPIQSVMGMPQDEIIDHFGEPEERNDFMIDYRSDSLDWLSFYFDSEGKVDSISASTVNFTYQGQSLYQDEDAIISLFGGDYENLGGAGGGYQIQWTWDEYYLVFSFPISGDDEGRFLASGIMVYK